MVKRYLKDNEVESNEKTEIQILNVNGAYNESENKISESCFWK